MSEPVQPEDNPYLATQVAEISTTVGDRKPTSPLAIIAAVFLGGITAVVTFCITFFFTCLGLMGPRGSSSPDTFLLVLAIAIVTAIFATAFAVWGFLKIVRALKK